MGTAAAPGLRWASWLRWLLVDEAVVTVGVQFREVALPLLMVSLWPSPRSYSLAVLLALMPRFLLGPWWGRVADEYAPRGVLIVSYVVRAAAVVGLVLAPTLAAACLAVLVGAVGTALYGPAMSHYQIGEDPATSAYILSRLRVVTSALQAVVPWLAGLMLAAWGRSLGFLVAAGAYAAAAWVMAALPYRAPARQRVETPPEPLHLPVAIRLQMAAVALFNGLAWMANLLYVAYILLALHAGAAAYGLALGLWGGAGLLSAALLPRIKVSESERLSGALLLMMAAGWAVMTAPVPFWVVAGLGVPEGFATWLLFDALQARILQEAPAGERGGWSAASARWSTGGRAAGLLAMWFIPSIASVHRGFLIISVLAVMGAAGVTWLTGTRDRARAAPPPSALG